MDAESKMEQSLSKPFLLKVDDASEDEYGGWKKEMVEEMKKQLWLAGPLIAVSVLQYCLQLISVMFVGHLGDLALSGASMATSFASVTGFSLLVSSVFSV